MYADLYFSPTILITPSTHTYHTHTHTHTPHTQIDYFNNKIICDLMEQHHTGIIALLDEACFLVGTVTDRVRERGREEGRRGEERE